MPLKIINGIEVLFLQGSPYEMGEEHGRLLKDRVQDLIANYVQKSLDIFEVPTAFLVESSKRCLPFIPKAYLEEMEALAEVSDVPFEELLALNCLSDVDGCYTQSNLNCCNFVLGPPATADGLFMHGRNFDFPHGRGAIDRAATLIARKPSRGEIATFSVTFAGHIGSYTACSASRLTAAEVGVPASDSSLEGMPISMSIRMGLEYSECIASFFAFMKSQNRTCGYNLAVSDGKSCESAAIETTRSLCERRGPRQGALVVDDVSFCKKTGHMRLTYPAGAFRYARMVELIRTQRGSITVESALGLLRDKFDVARGSYSGLSYNCICNMHTVQSVLFLPQAERLLVAIGSTPAPNGLYGELSLKEIFDQQPLLSPVVDEET